MSKVSKISIVLAWIVLIIAFMMMGYFTYDSFWPPELIKFADGMIPVARDFTKCDDAIQTFHPGDIVPLRFRGYKYTKDSPEIYTRMINDSVVTLPTGYSAKEIGPFNFVSLSRRIPRDAHAGLFYFEITYVYSRNFIRNSEIYKVRTEPFRIVIEKPTHDEAKDEAFIRRILKEMSTKNKKEWDEFRKRRAQFEKDREEFEKTKHGK